jgi:Niemann-Pick C1 protein
MFVIMQCWNNLLTSEKKRPLPERMGLTLQHAGVSITVTSVTDFVAFAIGATTVRDIRILPNLIAHYVDFSKSAKCSILCTFQVLPALQSFCVYAALGILATYVFQATFFVACLALDQERIEDNRNCIVPCYKHKDFKPNRCSTQNFAQTFFDKIYSKVLLHKASKVREQTDSFILKFQILMTFLTSFISNYR